MLIIIEGPEKQGKTTLAKYLCQKLGYQYKHEGPPTNGAQGYADQLLTWGQSGQNIVWDRSFIGELVYGPMFRGGACLTPLQLDVLCRLANNQGAVVVYAQQDTHTAVSWFAQENSVNRFDQLRATNHFEQLMQGIIQSRLPTIRYNAHTMMDTRRWFGAHDSLIESRANQAKLYRQVASRGEEFSGYGSCDPRTIYVGEQLSLKNQWLGKPFDGGPASEYLSDTLERAGIEQRDCYFLNAKVGNREASIRELDYLSSIGTRFVALGNVAHNLLLKNSVPHFRLAHPQYFKRFHASKKHLYVSLLQEARN